jgi:hypothetical protein
MTNLDGAAHVASMDQAAAQLADVGRGWAMMYRALCEGGIPPRLAGRIVDRQHAAACQTALLQTEWAVRRGAG